MFDFKKIKNNFLIKDHRWLFFILGVALFLRLYRVQEMAYFDFDQEYAANFAYRVWHEFPIQLIGQGLSLQGLFMGPLYFYYLTPFFILFKLHPLGGVLASVFLGLLTIWAYYCFGNQFFGKPAGLIGAFLRAILFIKIEADWAMVPAYSSELLILVTWFLFYRYWRGEVKVYPWIALVFGLYTSFHPILFPFYFVFLILFFFRRFWPNFKEIILSFFLFLLPLSPLILFEYFHKFTEVKVFLGLFLNRSSKGAGLLADKLINNFKIALLGFDAFLGFDTNEIFSVFLLLAVSFFLLKMAKIKKEKFHLLAFLATIFMFVFYYWFLPVHVPGYYLIAPVVILFFYFIGFLSDLILHQQTFLKMIPILFLIIISFFNLRLLYQKKWQNSYLTTMAFKDRAVKEILNSLPYHQAFSVSYLALPGRNFGFDYFFKLYNRIPQKDHVRDFNYTIVIPRELSPEAINVNLGGIGIILPKGG